MFLGRLNSMNSSRPIKCKLCEVESDEVYVDPITELCTNCTISEEYNQHERQIHGV